MIGSQSLLKEETIEFLLNGPQKNFINGEFRNSTSGKTFQTLNPATEEVLAEVEIAGEYEINLAVEAARKAFEGDWSKLTSSERGNLLLKLANLIEENKEVLAQLESLDNGKPYQRALEDDIPGVADYFRYYAGWTTKNFGQTVPYSSDYLTYTKHEPIGVVAAISPWNFPLMMVAWKLGAALATGCTVVIKPAELTPLTSIYFARLIEKAGFPKGVVNVVHGYGKETGEYLINHPGIDKITFTGSTVTGKHIMNVASKRVVPVTLELGGKSPNIIFEDADLSKAIPGAYNGIMYNHGQNCSAGSRIYVHRSIYDEVIAGLTELIQNCKLGNGLDNEIDMGPLVSRAQQTKVLKYIEDAVAQGATVITQENVKLEKGYFVPPTIIANIDESSNVAREEIFGPVAVVFAFETEDEVIARANDSDYGLAAGVWSENIGLANRVSNALKAGTVWVNCFGIEPAEVPFGGYKQSGIGRDNGAYALQNFTQVKTVWVSNN